ncbi:hypothetical protein [Qipengyuania sp. RANM35]|uniref:hypothetical protein n=1 Tax=Qipengyuania sp. RANM35 TaxID=3068635 RepID=UPI0034DB573B
MGVVSFATPLLAAGLRGFAAVDFFAVVFLVPVVLVFFGAPVAGVSAIVLVLALKFVFITATLVERGSP